VLIALTALAATVLGVGARADAHASDAWRRVTVHFGVDGYDFNVIDNPCNAAAPSACLIVAEAPHFTYTGDLVGTGLEVGTAGFTVQNFAIGRGSGWFSGTVNGCGSGTFMYTQETRFDAATGDGQTIYTIVPDSGTDQLQGITGQLQDGTGPLMCHPH
jgi:hypothetical protein